MGHSHRGGLLSRGRDRGSLLAPVTRLLRSAVGYWDVNNYTSGQTLTNYGTGGTALDAQFGSTTGSDTNDPTALPYAGVPYVYLPGSAGNTVACTAPGTVASYAAYPLGGGAATTGAATGGASFTLQTAGSWIRVDLLTAGAAVVASFDGARLTTGAQAAMTDAYSVAWTINRAATGRKAVVVVRPVMLFGTDDYLVVPDSSLLDFAAGESFTMLVVGRQWGAVPASSRWLIKGVSPGARWGMVNLGTSLAVQGFVADGTRVATASGATAASGALTSRVAVIDRATQTLTAEAVAASIATIGSMVNTNALRIGGDATSYNDMEFYGAAVFRRTVSASELTAITNYFTVRCP